MRLKTILANAVLVLLIVTSPMRAAATTTANLSLTPANATLKQGSTIAILIQVAAGTQKTSGVQACINFNRNELSIVNTDTSTSPLTYATPSSSADCATGELQISRFDVTHPSGNFTLAKLTFKSLISDSTTNVSFDSTKSYIKDDSTTDSSGNYKNILGSTSGATIRQTPIPATEASPDPASPSGANTISPALSDGKHSSQAVSQDVKGAKLQQSATNQPVLVKNSPTRTLLIISAGVVALLVATIILRKYVGIPGADPKTALTKKA